MQTKKYTHLFFDIDHTLWDFDKNSIEALRVLYEEISLKKQGITDFEEFQIKYHQINDKLWDRFRKGFLSREELRWKRMFQTLLEYKIYNIELAKQLSERYLDILPTMTLLFDGAKEVLTYCKQKGYELHLITNGFERTQHQKLNNSGIGSFFDKMISSEMAMSMKPHKEIFEFALTYTQAEASNSLMIGDALDVDIVGAMQVNIDQVYFNPNCISHNHTPTYEIQSLLQLKQIL